MVVIVERLMTIGRVDGPAAYAARPGEYALRLR
jgi:hypothetical protein